MYHDLAIACPSAACRSLLLSVTQVSEVSLSELPLFLLPTITSTDQKVLQIIHAEIVDFVCHTCQSELSTKPNY